MSGPDLAAEDARDRRAALAFAQILAHGRIIGPEGCEPAADRAYEWLRRRSGTPDAAPGQLDRIEQQLEKIVTAQDDINARAASIEAGVTAINTAVSALQAEMARLASQGVDTSALDTAVAHLGVALEGLTALPGATPAAPAEAAPADAPAG